MPRNAVTNRFAIKDLKSSVLFNGTSSTVAYSGAGVTGFASASSFSGWIRIASGSTTLRILVARWGTGGSDRAAICFQQSSPVGTENYVLQAGYYNGSAYTKSGFARVPVNTWFHYAFTWDGVTAKSYINGTLLGGTSADPASGVTTGLSLGNQGGAFFIGNQSNVKLYTRALSQDEVTALSQMRDGEVSTSGLWIDWRMDEGAGGSVTDYSGNSRTGTITSGSFSADSPMKARKQINGNKVINGDFEYAPPFTSATATSARWIDGTSGGSLTNDLFGWYIITGAGAINYSFDSTTRYQGSYSIKFNATNATGRGRILTAPFETSTTAALVAQYGIRVSPNTDYNVSAYIKTASASASSVRVQVLYYTETGAQSGGSANTAFQASTQDFTLASARFTTASTTSYVVVRLDDNTASGAAHQVWFDNVTLTPVYPEGRVPANGNLVKNFDFEVAPTFVAATTTAARWIDGTSGGSTTNSTYKWAAVSGAITPSASVSFDTSVSRSGLASLKLSTLDASGAAVASHTLDTASPADRNVLIPLLPSTSYTLNLYIKTSNVATNGAYAFIREYSGAISTLATTNTSKLSGTNDWTLVSLTFTTNASTQYGALALLNNVPGNISDAWFDDIYLAPTTNPGRVVIT